MKKSDKTLCVVGASGLVGSNIVKAGLDRGYTVHGTMRDKDAPSTAPFLNALAGAFERLSLFKADMAKEETFDEAMVGADCVFIAVSFRPMPVLRANRRERWTMSRGMRRSSSQL